MGFRPYEDFECGDDGVTQTAVQISSRLGDYTADFVGDDDQGLEAVLPAAAQAVFLPADEVSYSSASTGPTSGSRSGLTIDRRSLCSIIKAVS